MMHMARPAVRWCQHTSCPQACMVLQSVAEEVTQFYDDLDMEAKRQLLSTLTASLPMVLPFLTSTLEAQYQAAIAAGQDTAAKAHRSAVTAALGMGTPFNRHTQFVLLWMFVYCRYWCLVDV